MNILILNWRDTKHPLAGGAEEALMRHALYWKKKGARVQWFSSAFPQAKRHESIDGIRYIRAGSHYTVHMYCIIFKLKGIFQNPDIIIDCHHFLPFFTPLFYRKTKRIVFIHEIAGSVWFKNISLPIALIGYLLEPLSLILYRKTQFMTVSSSTKKELIAHNIPSRNIAVIHNGITKVAVSSSVKKEKIPTIIFLGTISKDKGIYDAFKSVSFLQKRIPRLNFWIVGKEQTNGIVQSCLEKFQFRKSYTIKYFGFVDQVKKFALLRQAWILVHPSQKEGWGLSVIEAASQKTPTIGYNVEGLRDSIVNGKTGVLVNRNPRDLGKKIAWLVLNKKKSAELRKNAYSWSQNFSWEESTQKSWKLINEVLK